MIRRSPIRYKRKERKVSWRTGRIREDAAGMARLRSEAYERSQGVCECNRPECLARPLRLRRVTYNDGHLHHVISRAHGGSDVLSNCIFITRKCHEEIHGIPRWSTLGRVARNKGVISPRVERIIDRLNAGEPAVDISVNEGVSRNRVLEIKRKLHNA